jgi:integrase/recombinase XerD
MTRVRAAMENYLRIRRGLGFEMPQDGRLLEGFVDFLEQAGAERITTELALDWARKPADAHPHTWRQRLIVARGFARHLATIDTASEVPSPDLLPGHRPRIAPYIYADSEIAALIDTARGLRPPLRAARHVTLIGLLAVTAMRPGEAVALDRDDVDLRHGVVHVRAGKQKKQREVPLHASTVAALRDYTRLRDTAFPTPGTPAFFISTRGGRMARSELNQTFTRLIGEVGLDGHGARRRPRPHDLRHTLAVRTLLGWLQEGEDVDRRMPLLSTYLGHVDPASTYWYLEAVPELLEVISRRLEQLPEVFS